MSDKELENLLQNEVDKGNAILVNKKNLAKLFRNKSLKDLEKLISNLMEASSVNDDVMRLDTIMIIQEIIKARKNVLKGEFNGKK